MLADLPESTRDLAWRVVNDSVMGGRSEGDLHPEGRSLVFSGRTNTDGGGFSSIRSEARRFDLGAFDGIRLRVRGDGRRYTFRLTTRDTREERRRPSYWADFETAGSDWEVVEVPFRRLPSPLARTLARRARAQYPRDRRSWPDDLRWEGRPVPSRGGHEELDRGLPSAGGTLARVGGEPRPGVQPERPSSRAGASRGLPATAGVAAAPTRWRPPHLRPRPAPKKLRPPPGCAPGDRQLRDPARGGSRRCRGTRARARWHCPGRAERSRGSGHLGPTGW